MRNTIRLRLNSGGLTFLQPTLRKWQQVDRETAGTFLKNVVNYRKLPFGRPKETVKLAPPANPNQCECGHLDSIHSEKTVMGERPGQAGKACLDSSCDCWNFRSSDPQAREERRKRNEGKLKRLVMKAAAGAFGPRQALLVKEEFGGKLTQ